jgi:hypothetical protein
MADRGNGLVRLDEGAHEGHGLFIDAQCIGVHHAAGQQQRIEVLGVRCCKRHIDFEGVGRVVVIPAAHAAVHGRDDLRERAGDIQRLARLGHLDLLEAVRNEDGDFHSVQ